MTNDLREVEFPGDEKQRGPHGAKPLVPLGLVLGGVKEPVQGLKKAVGMVGLRPGDNAVELFPTIRATSIKGSTLECSRFLHHCKSMAETT